MTAAAPADGFLLLDKPPGVSSFQALGPVKRLFRGRKVGHAGTLDPAATGLLLAAVGHGTRLLEFLEGLPKTYRFTLRLGVVTDTYDLEGEVQEEKDASSVGAAAVASVMERFRGNLVQVPPAYSAVKIAGKRACDRVRAGETVELKPRNIQVTRLDLISFAPGAAVLELDCSKGTYVRTLAHDIGQALGCGAAADAIRRLAIGTFRVEGAVAPDAATAGDLLPLDGGMDHIPALRLRREWLGRLRNGNAVPAAAYAPLSPLEPAPPPAVLPPLFRILAPEGGLLGVGSVDPAGRLQPRKLLIG